jgi:hypothetical protein
MYSLHQAYRGDDPQRQPTVMIGLPSPGCHRGPGLRRQGLPYPTKRAVVLSLTLAAASAGRLAWRW